MMTDGHMRAYVVAARSTCTNCCKYLSGGEAMFSGVHFLAVEPL